MLNKRRLFAILSVLLMIALVGCSVEAVQLSSPEPPEEPLEASFSEPADEPEPLDEPAAIAVRHVEGEVTFLHGGNEKPLSKSTLLYEGDAVKTGEDGMAVLKLDDDKQIQIAPDSHVEITGFERGDAGDKTLLLLHRGNVINILDAPLGDADSYEVETPALVMAVRGTIASVSSDPDSGLDHVLLFEGHSVVSAKASEDVADIKVGGYAGTAEEHFESRAFTGADLGRNEYWFLYEADYPAVFDEDNTKISERLRPLLDNEDYQEEVTAAGTVNGLQTAAGEGTAAPGSAGAGGSSGESPATGDAPAISPPANETPAAGEAPPANDPTPDNGGGGGGMDEATFRAIEQEFLQAKQDYNSGNISKDAFLAIKQKYIEAKRLYYGD